MYGFNLVPSPFALKSTVRRFLACPVKQTDTSLQPAVDFEITSYHMAVSSHAIIMLSFSFKSSGLRQIKQRKLIN